MIKQLHVVENSNTNSGGEGLAARRYAESIAHEKCLVTLASKSILSDQLYPSKNQFFTQISFPTSKILFFNALAQYLLIKKMYKIKKFNIIHLHGMWSPSLLVAALFAIRMKIPFMISPHGCLEPWALSYRRNKKKLALYTYQGIVLRSASMFVATSNQEFESIRKLGFLQPVAVIPNGVDVMPRQEPNMQAGDKIILFLSRVHPIKGLLDLVEAWGAVRQQGWSVVVAGGDEDGYLATVIALVKSKGLESDFKFIGFVEGARKQECFDAATVFILPTYSENFGIVVAEALARELPVITTTAAPWSDLVEYDCGWWVSPGVRCVSEALSKAMACSSDELRAMGRRGRQLVINKYLWSQIGAEGFAVSHWLLNQSSTKPSVINVMAAK
jgi:glycosyltransferase involved in cell wall biosynthesis